MKHLIDESRGSTLAHWTAVVVLALGHTSCASSRGASGADDDTTADLAVEIDTLAAELTERASLRIPLGSARVLVEHPIAVRPERNRYWPEHLWAEEQHAAQAALEFELEIALANRMNVVGIRNHAHGPEAAAGFASAALAAHTDHVDATHALLTTFLFDGFELELTVQLVALDSRWIVATARRRIFGFSPDAYDAPLGLSVAMHTDTEVPESMPVGEHTPVAPVAASAAPSVVHVTPTPARAATVPPAPTSDRAATPTDEVVPVVASEGPSAMRRRALERIAAEVAARAEEGPNAP
jgi:hypothetical protein